MQLQPRPTIRGKPLRQLAISLDRPVLNGINANDRGTEFVVTPAKAIRRGGVTAPTHRTISALDPAMILFNSVVEILAGPASRRHPTLSGWPVGNCHARPWSPAPGLRR
jgi:hypothetical protein